MAKVNTYVYYVNNVRTAFTVFEYFFEMTIEDVIWTRSK